MKIRDEEADPVIDPATKPRSVDLHIPLPNDNDAYVYFGKRPTKEDIDTLTRHLMLMLQQVRAHFGYPPMQRIHQALDELGIAAPGTRRRQKTHA